MELQRLPAKLAALPVPAAHTVRGDRYLVTLAVTALLNDGDFIVEAPYRRKPEAPRRSLLLTIKAGLENGPTLIQRAGGERLCMAIAREPARGIHPLRDSGPIDVVRVKTLIRHPLRMIHAAE